jgi:asparagine synthase (glutamine-hydrolysing)
MCGIVGIVDSSTTPLDEIQPAVRRMSEKLAHRGPDDWGMVSLREGRVESCSMSRPQPETLPRPALRNKAKTIVLGHRRLAIIDLSSNGHQPMQTSDGRMWIVFNGEIYNYRQLRAGLEADGVKFRSNSDTEVLLALFAREGEKCLQLLRGMFAFAVWDEKSDQLFLARDRFGIKPLYYAKTSGGAFVFASELSAILSSGLVSAQIDEEAEAAFLQRGSIASPRTLYKRIRSVPPGHFATLRENTVRVESYWSLVETLTRATSQTSPIENVEKQIRESLVESVRAHMVSDVPVGVFLSGGLDSTAIVASIRQFYSGPLKTYSVVFPGTDFDEGMLARNAAQRYETQHTEIPVTREDFMSGLDEVFSVMDQPTVDGVNTYFVAKCVREAGGKVALSGLGGDEVLGGYKSFVAVPRLHRLLGVARRAPFLAAPASMLVSRLPVSQAPKLAHLLSERGKSLEDVWRGYKALFTDEQVREMGLKQTGQNRSDLDTTRLKQFWRIARMEIDAFMSPQLLRDSDVFTMCHSLELRTPFVDHVFLASVLSAGSWPVAGASTYKLALFRKMNGFLPTGHLSEPKRGFVLPFEDWLREALSRDSVGLGRDLRVRLAGKQQRDIVDRFTKGKTHWSRVWALYVLERFRSEAVQ